MQDLLSGKFASEPLERTTRSSHRGSSSQVAALLVHNTRRAPRTQPERRRPGSPRGGGVNHVGPLRGQRPISRNPSVVPSPRAAPQVASSYSVPQSARSEYSEQDPVEVVMKSFSRAFQNVNTTEDLRGLFAQLATDTHPTKGFGLNVKRTAKLLNALGFPADASVARDVIRQYDKTGTGKLYFMEVMHPNESFPSARSTKASPRHGSARPSSARSTRSARSTASSRVGGGQPVYSPRSEMLDDHEDFDDFGSDSFYAGAEDDGEGMMLTGRKAPTTSARGGAPASRKKPPARTSQRAVSASGKGGSRGPSRKSTPMYTKKGNRAKTPAIEVFDGPKIATTKPRTVSTKRVPHKAQLGHYW